MNPSYANYLNNLNPDVSQQVTDFYGTQNYNAYSNINPNAYAGMSTKDNPGDRLYADLIRAQTQDYNQRFAPIENFMAGQITATRTKSLGADLSASKLRNMQVFK